MKKASPRLRSRKGLLSFGAAALLAVSAATGQVAGGAGSTAIDATGNYRSEVQACLDGRSPQDRDTCLREARNARAEKQRGTLEQSPTLEANAKARCDVFAAGEERAACEARVMGFGGTSGSVEGGGILRQVETVVLPQGQTEVTIQPQTPAPVLLVPATKP
ncbi:MAG TPA: hypothetical protein VEA40_24840 [Ramlibacter sp.]|nr:hypothetical protein [Ramlibacter sp.]